MSSSVLAKMGSTIFIQKFLKVLSIVNILISKSHRCRNRKYTNDKYLGDSGHIGRRVNCRREGNKATPKRYGQPPSVPKRPSTGINIFQKTQNYSVTFLFSHRVYSRIFKNCKKFCHIFKRERQLAYASTTTPYLCCCVTFLEKSHLEYPLLVL